MTYQSSALEPIRLDLGLVRILETLLSPGKEITMRDEEFSDYHGPILTRRQRQVLRLQAYGLSHRELGAHLELSVWTVKNHHKQAIRTLAGSLRSVPRERVRTSLACYILGLIDAG